MSTLNEVLKNQDDVTVTLSYRLKHNLEDISKPTKSLPATPATPSTPATQTENRKVDDDTRMTFRCPQEIVKELDEVRKKRPGRISRNQAIIESIQCYVNDADPIKKSATYSLPQDVLEMLENFWMLMRSYSSNKRITKTLIVEMAIFYVIQEYEKYKENSFFYKKLMKD